jgi:2-polyprenyl-6-methoxyphenol hydroxylase-like FAD-dependent oxidoreductase
MLEILVVGAGPVGLTMAAELARHGVSCRIIDRLVEPLPYCRAIGVTPRTLEVWDDMGVARDMIDAGLWLDGRRLIINGQKLRDEGLEFSDLPYAELGLPQYETERLLNRPLNSFGIAVEHSVELAALSQRSDRSRSNCGALMAASNKPSSAMSSAVTGRTVPCVMLSAFRSRATRFR